MASLAHQDSAAVEAFIGRWKASSGAERANYGLFLIELCELLGVERPRPAGQEMSLNDYVFERSVRFRHDDGTSSPGRIDLYKRGCFVLEAKQSKKRQVGGDTYEQLPLQLKGGVGLLDRPRAKAAASWDALMRGAKRQAEDYARCLDEWPPFVVVIDVGSVIELYANFRRDGKGYEQFPDRTGYRISMDDLRRPEMRERLKAVWTSPFALDPAAQAADVTQGIAALLARMTKSMEGRVRLEEPELKAEHAYKVSKFLMRCIFAMFAEDVGLLPERAFLRLIETYKPHPGRFHIAATDFFTTMDRGGHSIAVQADIRRFNGGLFKDAVGVEVTGDELALLEQAAKRSWRFVEPAIFGTLLEQALSDRERSKLGAHYTPRAYVERLVVPTIMEPLRDDWENVQADAVSAYLEKGAAAARQVVKSFHDRLCDTLVLDPACGTGNFLYVSLELMKRLEGEVLEFLRELGESSEPLRTIDPHQFLGIEKNPRAVPIAELVLWIGYIQWWFRTKGRSVMQEPILRDFGTVRVGDAVLAYDREEPLRGPDGRPVTRQDPNATKLHPITGEPVPDPNARLQVYRYANPRPAVWPEADFVVGNPPFISGKGLRSELGDGYAEALWASRGKRSDSIDFVMYWWDAAAIILRAKGSRLRRVGLITTNSITQKFSRRVIEKHLGAPQDPVSLVFAVPDHPWVKSGRSLGKKAAVRIAMTVAELGRREGKLAEVVQEVALDTDQPLVGLQAIDGRINADLTVGVDLTRLAELQAAEGLSGRGVQLMGDGFIVSPQQAAGLGLGRVPGLEQHIKPYLHNRDLKARPRGVMVIDLFGLTEQDVRSRYPAVYQWISERVKPERDVNARESYKERWWVFGEPRALLRPAISGLSRLIVTGETSRHRFFEFFDPHTIADNMVRVIASDDGYDLGVMSSRAHSTFSVAKGGWMGVGNDPRYQAECFSTFPFPAATPTQQTPIRALAEELDALRKCVIAEHGFLTMTRIYNARERLVALEAGRDAGPLTEAERAIHDAGCVGVIHELHKRIDAAVADAYGWPVDLCDQDILARLLALNRERAVEERNGFVRWLRPDYQEQRFSAAGRAPKAEQIEADLAPAAAEAPALPTDVTTLSAALRRAMRAIGRPAEAREIAGRFRDGAPATRRVERGLANLAATGVARRAPNGWFVADRGS